MYNLTHNNHFKFGYNEEWFRFRQSHDDRWMVTYGARKRAVGTFREECYRTAALIRDSVSEPITILFSGGADSEIVVRSFHDQKIPFKVAVCQFTNNLNAHDVSYAAICCNQLGIKYDMISLDVRAFFDGPAYDYAAAVQSVRPELCTTMWLADQVDGVPIIGSGECYLVKRVPDDYINGVSPYETTPWDLYERELIASWYRHFMVPGKERMAVPGFFQYTPEIMLSFLNDSKVVELVNNEIVGKRSTMTSKFSIYQRYFPKLAYREKYSGFEKIEDRVDEMKIELEKKWPSSNANHLTEYHTLLDILGGKTTGPKGILLRNISEATSLIDETRQLTIDDYDQAMGLIKERPSNVVEFDKAKLKTFITMDDDVSQLGEQLIRTWENLLPKFYLQGATHKMFGSFCQGKLMSMVGMRLIHDNCWVLSSLKARDVSLMRTGLKETMTMLYQHAKEIGLSGYYCCVAKYRYKKFQLLMSKLVPQQYGEYEDEVLATIPAKEKPEVDFWWSMMGRRPQMVDIVIKKMTLKESV